MVGKNIVEQAINQGCLHPDSIMIIDGVPHAQILRL
jgi:hypothetical protein